MVTAIVLIKAERGQAVDVARKLGEIHEVSEVHSVAGPYDLVAKVQVEEYELMAQVITEQLQRVAGILSTETLMAFHTYKF
ncbi:MAG: Lrp/AsnC ligand binding domain-containing protein [Dehalococcoidia bacterium]|nr:Lrp/AsnC ligand binding domain-containing protein [Dehalococcoidia bacterium]